MNAKPFTHAEAFRLMWYACPCGHRERIWNSRDGVTPFGLNCPSCGMPELRHVDWKLDEFVPKHQLKHGQRYFEDGTVEDAVAIIERRITNFKKQGHEPPPGVAEALRRDAKEQDGEWLAGWPIVRRYEPPLQLAS